MSKETVTEWAIQDEATGEWWGRASTVGWGGAGNVYRYSYARAVSATSEIIRGTPTARIVPAPPREMTDAECEAWLFDTYYVIGHLPASPNWGVWRPSDRIVDVYAIALAPKPFDAIRAARKKLEGK